MSEEFSNWIRTLVSKDDHMDLPLVFDGDLIKGWKK
jgi:hypothetical protein